MVERAGGHGHFPTHSGGRIPGTSGRRAGPAGTSGLWTAEPRRQAPPTPRPPAAAPAQKGGPPPPRPGLQARDPARGAVAGSWRAVPRFIPHLPTECSPGASATRLFPLLVLDTLFSWFLCGVALHGGPGARAVRCVLEASAPFAALCRGARGVFFAAAWPFPGSTGGFWAQQHPIATFLP